MCELGISQAATSVKVQPDGKILVAGGGIDFFLLRYNADGSLDPIFINKNAIIVKEGLASAHFMSQTEIARSIDLQSDGRIVVAGDVTSPTGSIIYYGLACFNTDGSLDKKTPIPLINPITKKECPISSVKGVKVLQGGKIAVVGAVQMHRDSTRDYTILRCESNLALDNSFGVSGQVTRFVDGESSENRSIVLQTDRKIVVAGFTI